MRAGALAILFLIVWVSSSCGSSNARSARGGPTELSSTATPTTGSGLTGVGERSIAVSGAVLSGGDWLTIGLHPTAAPIRLTASGSAPLEVCPAGLDGQLNDSSWPPWSHFPSCIGLGPSGATPLPATDGAAHVSFAIKAATSAARTRVAVTVDYTAVDSFFEASSPADAPRTDLSVTYEPRSSTTAALATPVDLASPAPGYRVVLTQGGRSLTSAANCDFPTELEGCVAVTARKPVVVRLTGPRGRVTLEAAWK
jgi:hypothetical protein